MSQKSTVYTALAAGMALLVLLFGLLYRVGRDSPDGRDGEGTALASALEVAADVPTARRVVLPGQLPVEGEVSEGLPFANFAARVLRMLRDAQSGDEAGLENEVLLTFATEEAYQRFLSSLGGRKLSLLGKLDSLRTVRVGFDNVFDLAGELGTLDPSETTVISNYLVTVPLPSESVGSPGAGAGAVPFGRLALELLGIRGDNSSFGEGVLIAVLDSGIQDHAVFAGKTIREIDMVFDAAGNPVPIDPENGHGTAVASIIAGNDARLPGVAPIAELISYRILDNSGATNSFVLAQAIVAAVDAGVDIINASLGSLGDSLLVRQAVDYALAADVLIVAPSGNEGASLVSYPAALDGVVAVSANDARGEHVDFSNSGSSLEAGGISAPGYGVLVAWPGDRAISFSGTSASVPYVVGAVATVMSENPGMPARVAYQLLLDNSNEAGAPGADPFHGVGNLNVGRALASGTAGILDVAIASYYYDPALAEGARAQGRAQVVVENRGTEPLHNVLVEVNSGAGPLTYNLSFIPAGGIAVIETSIDVAAGEAAGVLNVSASARLNEAANGRDQNISDNSLSTSIEFPTGG